MFKIDNANKTRKPKDLVVGKKVSEGLVSWKGADLTMSFYIGNVDVGANCDVMKSDIKNLGVDVVEFEELRRRHNHFKSFRLVIKRKDFDAIKDPLFWPDGVVVRKFFRRMNGDGNAMTTNST